MGYDLDKAYKSAIKPKAEKKIKVTDENWGNISLLGNSLT
jgi:hypothetical protein